MIQKLYKNCCTLCKYLQRNAGRKVRAGRLAVATDVITSHWQAHWPVSICWAEALICRISLQLRVSPSVISVTGRIMAVLFLTTEVIQCYEDFSLIFCPKSFVRPPSFLHFTVEAIQVTGYSVVLK